MTSQFHVDNFDLQICRPK